MDYDFEAFAQKRIANNKTTTSTASANQQASQSMSSVGGRGLGSPSFSTNTSNQDDDDNDTGGAKSFMDTVFSWFNASGAPDPKMPPSYDGSSVYDRDEFKPISYDPTTNRTTIRGVNTGVDMRSSDEIMADIDAMLDRSDDTSYKNVYESTYDEVPESLKGVEDFKSRKAMTSGINTAIKGIMDTEQRQSKAMKDAINRTIESVMSNSPDVPYVIQAGDTLSEIAVKTGTTVKELQKLNNIEKANEIYTGNELIIPSNKSTKTKEDIVSSLIGGMGGVSELGSSFEGDGVQTASSGEIVSDVTSAEDITRTPGLMVKPKIRPKSIEVKAVQSALTKLGYNPNGVDGVIGGGTQRAIRKFQKQNGLPVTGEMTKETQSAILSDNAPSYFDPPKKDAKVIDFSESDFYIFKEAVAGKESSNRYNIRGGANNHYLGKYQMGKDALSDVGIKYNRASNRKFLTNPEQQEKAFKKYTEKNHKKLTQESQAYREMTPKEKLAVLGYAHNQGATAAVEFLFTGVSGKDAFGTKGKEYIGLVTDAFSRNQPIPRPQPRPENL